MKHTRAVLFLSGLFFMSGFSVALAEAEDGYPLDLRQSVLLALKNNYRVEDGQLSSEQASEEVRRQRGVFDPTIAVRSGDFRQEYSNGSLPSGSGVQTSASVGGLLPTGTEYNVSVTTTELKNVAPEDRQSTGLYAEVRQNLMKGFGWRANVAPVRVAAKNAAISRLEFERDVSALITEVNHAYFDVILAEQNARVARESLGLVERLCSENMERLALKSIAESDLFQAQAERAARRENLFEAVRLEGDAENALRLLIADSPENAVGMTLSVAPLAPPEKVVSDARADFRRALSARQDYRKAVLGLERDQIDSLRASNAALPDLEAFAQGYWDGSGSDFNKSYGRAMDNGRPDYYAGLSLSFDFPNQTARAEKSIARKQIRRAQLTLSELERRIAVEVDNGARRIECDWNRLVTARESRELAEKSLKAEQERYDIGLSSTFVLLSLQTDLMNAQLRELSAENGYRKSVVDYQRTMGITLVDNNVILP